MIKTLTLTVVVCIAVVVGAYFSPLLGVLAGVILGALIMAIRHFRGADDTEHFALSNDVADLTAEIIDQSVAINRECIADLNNVLHTQNEAITLLSDHFLKLQSVIDTQSQLISAIISPSGETSAQQTENIVKNALQHMQTLHSHPLIVVQDNRVSVNIADAVRSLQFGDINGQSLGFTIATLNTYNELLVGLLDDNKTLNVAKVQPQLAALQKLRAEHKNPVSSQSTAAGEVELF